MAQGVGLAAGDVAVVEGELEGLFVAEFEDVEFVFVVPPFELPFEPEDGVFEFLPAVLFEFLAVELFELVFVGFVSVACPLGGADELEFDDDVFAGVGVGLLLAYSAAAATSESRIARSVDRDRTRAIESTFIAIVSSKPNTSTIN